MNYTKFKIREDLNSPWLDITALQGEPGKSAYQIAVDKGYSGTEEEWLESLQGEKGDKGEAGSGSDVDLSEYAKKSELPTKTSDLENDSNFANQSYVDTQVAGLVDSAPEALNTLGELATALNNHEDAYDALLETVGKKANDADLAAVAKSGDYNDLSNKPTSLPASGGNAATVNNHTVNADVPADAKFTDTTYGVATTEEDGLMSAADKTKLDGLGASGGENNNSIGYYLGYYEVSDSFYNFTLSEEGQAALNAYGSENGSPKSLYITVVYVNEAARAGYEYYFRLESAFEGTTSYYEGVADNVRVRVNKDTYEVSFVRDVYAIAYNTYTKYEIDTVMGDKANATALGNYLPLTGGTITGTLQLDNPLSFSVYPGTVNSDPTNSFRTTIFGSSARGAKITPFFINYDIDKFGTQYSSGFAWGTSDTHGFLSTNFNGSNAFIGSGNGDKLNWKEELIHTGNINNYALTSTSPYKEAYLEWGGKNFSDSYGVIDGCLIDKLGADRFAAFNTSGIKVEHSTDSGSTWTESTAPEYENIFSTHSAGKIPLKYNQTDSSPAQTNNQMRVTLNADSGNVYTELRKLALYVTTNGSGHVTVTIEKNDYSNTNNWIKICENVQIAGWSGWNIINVDNFIFGGSHNGAESVSDLRFTFKIGEVSNPNYSGFELITLKAFGGVAWVRPSTLSLDGHIYTYDSGQNTYFPNNVYSNGAQLATQDWVLEFASVGVTYDSVIDALGYTPMNSNVKYAGSDTAGGSAYSVVLNQPSEDIYGLLVADNSGTVYDVTSHLYYDVGASELGNNSASGFYLYADSGFVFTSGDRSTSINYANALFAPSGALNLGDSDNRWQAAYFVNAYSTNGFYEDSDIRLKDIKEEITIDFEALKQIPKIFYTWKDEDKIQLGTIAQEVQKIYPEIVSEDQNGYLSIDYSKLSVIALKAIDVLNERLEKLEEQVYGNGN